MISSVSREAERELIDGALFYAREANAELGLAFVAEFERAIGILCDHPLVVTRKLAMLDAAKTLDFMRSPPGNRLETLRGDRAGQWSVRINDQWRLCFVWTDAGPDQVEIVDYH